MTHFDPILRYHHFVDFSTSIGRHLGSKGLGPSTFGTKIETRWTRPNPYVARLYAPNVGTSSHLFVPNKKSIRGCDAIDPKMLRICCVSAVGIADTTDLRFARSHFAFHARALTALHFVFECYRILQLRFVCPFGVL